MYNDTSLKDVDTAILPAWPMESPSTVGELAELKAPMWGIESWFHRGFPDRGEVLKENDAEFAAGRCFPTKTLNGFEIGSDENIVCRDAKKIYIFEMIDTFLW